MVHKVAILIMMTKCLGGIAMRCDQCGKELQEDETCPCRATKANSPRPPFPFWVIPGAVFTAITFGYIALKIAGCHYFLWVNILWPISTLLFFFMLARKTKHHRRSAKVIGIILAIILVFAAAGKDYLFKETVTENKMFVFVSDFFDQYVSTAWPYGPIIYKYQNFIWYGPSLGRWSDYYIYHKDNMTNEEFEYYVEDYAPDMPIITQ